MTVLKKVDDDIVRAKVVQQIIDCDANNHQQIKFLLSLGDGALEEIISYNELSDLVNESMQARESGEHDFTTYSRILDHQGPLKKHDPKYKGSSYNVLVSWHGGTQTWEPLNIIAKQDPVTLARYAFDNGLLNKPGWKFLCHTAKRQCFVNVITNAIKRRKDNNQVRYKFSVRVPQTYAEAVQLDNENGNSSWQDGVRRELDQIFSYHTFRDLGISVLPGPEYKRIKVRLVFDVKADRKRKGRLLARGDMTPEPEESVYSSVASLRSLRIVIFLAELNQLELMQGDIVNAYLESHTQEKVYFVAGSEFRHLAGHTFIIDKALFGLRSSGLRFHERLSSVIWKFGFEKSKADPDVWMRDSGDIWEYIVVYVDDLSVAMKHAQSFFDELQSPKIGFTMKGVGKPTYTLGQTSSVTRMAPCALDHKHMPNAYVRIFHHCMGRSRKPPSHPWTMMTILS